MLAFTKSPGTKPGDIAGHRFTGPGGLAHCKSMFVWPPSTYAKWPSTRPEQQINAVGLGYVQITCNDIYIYHEIVVYSGNKKVNLHTDYKNLIWIYICLALSISNCLVLF